MGVRGGVRGACGPGAALPGSDAWQRPLLDADGSGYALLATWSALLATALGTMGLPHVIVRFHTSPDGRSARRTAAITVAMLGTFYLFPAVYGLLGAVLLPELYFTGATDTVVVALPARVDPGLAGGLFTALLTAGAFAAFLATSLGLLLALAGAVAYDLVPGTLRRLRLTALVGAGIVVLLALPAAGRRRRAGDVGVHRGRVDVLPAARARHLVVAAHRPGRAGGDGGRAARVGGGDGRGPGGRARARPARAAARAARDLVGAAGVRDDDPGVAARHAGAVGHVGDAAPAPRRDPRRGHCCGSAVSNARRPAASRRSAGRSVTFART